MDYSFEHSSVPIHVELCMNHVEIILITHKFWVNNIENLILTYYSGCDGPR